MGGFVVNEDESLEEFELEEFNDSNVNWHLW